MSDEKKAIGDGGPAFACAACYGHQEGMSLRAYVAVHSLDIAFYMERRNPTHNSYGYPTYQGAAERAVLMADALIRALEVPNV